MFPQELLTLHAGGKKCITFGLTIHQYNCRAIFTDFHFIASGHLNFLLGNLTINSSIHIWLVYLAVSATSHSKIIQASSHSGLMGDSERQNNVKRNSSFSVFNYEMPKYFKCQAIGVVGLLSK